MPCIRCWAADSPWASLIPFRRVEASPNKRYELTDENGPWLIFAAYFAGPTAEKKGHELVLELRSRFKLPAYMHRQTYDFTQPVEGTKLTPMGTPAKMRYFNADKYDGISVLVGDFRSVEDADLEKTLDRLKQITPDCMSKNRGAEGNEMFAGLKDLKRRISSMSNQQQPKGPLGTAFATRNPLLPEEVFAPGGVDDFVARLNRGVTHCLLDNPGQYTIRVATFRGKTTINQREIEELETRDRLTDKLEVGADKAHRMTVALRERGVEAYEFHNRTESMVCVGSFDSEGELLPNGAVDINPAMYKVIEQYRAVERQVPGKAVVGLQPRIVAGIAFDVQPVPMAVPRRSVAADYSRR